MGLEDVDLDNFVNVYTKNMGYLSSQKARKINCIACIRLLTVLPIDIVVKYFERIIKEVVPEVYYFINEKKNKIETRKNLNLRHFSKRKKEIRGRNVFKEVDLVGLLKDGIGCFEKRVGESGLSVVPFEKKDLETRLMALLKF